MSGIPFIGYAEGEALLRWDRLAGALAAGHDLPRAQIGDTFLYRDRDTLLSRSAWIDGLGMAVKTATVFPGNPGAGKPMVNGALCLFSNTDGTAEAFVDFRLVTKWKTAGDSLLAARRLARPDAERILIVGAGTVGASLIEAFRAGFPAATITLWNRTGAKAQSLASAYPGTEIAADLETAVRAADIVISATMTTDPILKGAWLREGQHINLIGAYRPDMREADDDALRMSRLYVDSFDTTIGHIGEIETPLSQGTISRTDLRADFYDLEKFSPADGRTITLFKNGGGAHLDLMTARHILSLWRADQATAG